MRPSRKKKRFETLLWNWDFVYLCLALSLDESSGEGVTAHIYTFYSDNKLIISRCDSRDCGGKNFFTHFSQLLTFKSSKIRSRDSEISSRRETSLSMKFISPKKLWHSFKVYKVFLLEKAKELSAACLHMFSSSILIKNGTRFFTLFRIEAHFYLSLKNEGSMHAIVNCTNSLRWWWCH